LFEGLTVDEMAFEGRMVVQGGVDGCEFLSLLHLPEPQHRSLASSERRVAALDTVVGPAADLLLVGVAQFLHRCLVGAQPSVMMTSGDPWRLSDFFMNASAAPLSLVLPLGAVQLSTTAVLFHRRYRCPAQKKQLLDVSQR
jgi:hypothetical protein